MLQHRIAVLALLSLAACERSSTSSPPSTSTSTSIPTATATAAATATGTTSSPASAKVGAPAPDFSLKDLDGNAVSLASFRGKTVVLEWFNPGCPFVRKSHTVGSLKDLPASALTRGVVWLAINSAAPGREGNGAEVNRKVSTEFGMKYPILIDEDGAVGHTYAATNTPHMYVVDPQGTLVYAGAIDNSPDGEGESPTDGKLVNYVDAALGDLAAHRAVGVAQTKAYGCSVKYASK